MKPEEKSEIILWDWLKTKGNNVREIYFNRKNQVTSKIFTTSGLNKKPDFIISVDFGYGLEYIAVEIKNTNQSRNIHDAGKILDYYENYINGSTKYYIDDVEIKINHFVVATENSVEGKLFKDDNNITLNCESGDSNRKFKSLYGHLPKQEYQRTSDYLRGIWADWRRFKDKTGLNKDLPSIGILISDFYNPINYPHLFVMIYSGWSSKRWGQRFWRL